MNPILQLLLGSTLSRYGQPFQGNQTSDLKGLTDALAAYKQAAGPDDSDKSQMGPLTGMDRIKAAFDSLKDMHKGPDQTAANTAVLPANGASPFDNAQWPYGPVGAPSQSMASGPSTPGGVPMPQPRPADAPQASPMMSLFQRSAAMQQDPLTGDYIDPAAAAKAQPNIFHGLFG
jgi:hypothetical protein